MLFNSIDFAIFFPIVFLLYWFVTQRNLRIQNLFPIVFLLYWFVTQRNLRIQNLLIVAASYVFYGWWDWRFLSLLLFSSLLDFGIGLGLAKQSHPGRRRALVTVSLVANLGLLGVFKYFHFFVDSFTTAFSFLGQPIASSSLNIILPVGISFYTFQTLSYTIDVYRREMKPTRDLVAFMAFVGFFPQLVAGPIERARNLLPQFFQKRQFRYSEAVEGLRQILWGLFKKMVIADNCAVHANAIFGNSSTYPGSMLVLGAVFFAFQIYGDFSGYSDIAIGTARLLGFRLTQNFATPYFSRDIAEFWRRWHISLTTWFRDYLYIPLGGSRGSRGMTVRNIFIIFAMSGLWHGANWTFVAWGVLNAFFFLPLLLRKTNRRNLDIVAQGRHLPTLRELGQMGLTFGLTLLAWVFFRAEDMAHAFSYLRGIFSPSILVIPPLSPVFITLGLVGFMVAIEWVGREAPFALSRLGLHWRRPVRWAFYSFLLFLIGMFMQTQETPFIYFQF